MRAAREAIGPDAELFVDANGAYSRKQALAMAEAFAELRRDLVRGAGLLRRPRGLRLIRDRAPAGMDIAAGEYGYDLFYFRRMLEAGAVDVLQADATRCGGITGFLRAGALCEARSPAVLGPLRAVAARRIRAARCRRFRHLEYFHDHDAHRAHALRRRPDARSTGRLRPDPRRPGLGLEFKRQDAAALRRLMSRSLADKGSTTHDDR